MERYTFTHSVMANSSALRWLGYDLGDRRLFVMYRGSDTLPARIYRYEAVPAEFWDSLVYANAQSNVSTMGFLRDSRSIIGDGTRLAPDADLAFEVYHSLPSDAGGGSITPSNDETDEVVEENYSLNLGGLKDEAEAVLESEAEDADLEAALEDEAYALNLATLGDGDPVRTATEDLNEPENAEATVANDPYSDLMSFEFEVNFRDDDSPDEAAFGRASVHVRAEDEVYAIEYVETLFNVSHVNLTSVKRYL